MGPLVLILSPKILINSKKCLRGFPGHSENFSFLHIKQHHSSLLKTTSVRVSFIQIMQVRVQNKGKSVWKSRYVGDVSAPPSSNLCLSSSNSVDKLKVIKKNFYKSVCSCCCYMKIQHSSFSKYYELTILTITHRSHNYSYQ